MSHYIKKFTKLITSLNVIHTGNSIFMTNACNIHHIWTINTLIYFAVLPDYTWYIGSPCHTKTEFSPHECAESNSIRNLIKCTLFIILVVCVCIRQTTAMPWDRLSHKHEDKSIRELHTSNTGSSVLA